MRPSLSSLVRSILLESATDEDVIVKPVHVKDQRPREAEPGDEKGEMYARIDRNKIATAKRSAAQVNTESWRNGAMRTFEILDKHPRVKDVIVSPFAMADLSHDGLPPEISRTRAFVGTADQANRVFEMIGMPETSVDPRDVVIVPVVGGHTLPVNAGTFPSPWMTMHSIFDNLEIEEEMDECSRIQGELIEIIGRKLSLGMLINCKWSENSFALATAAGRSMGDFREHLRRHEAGEVKSPANKAVEFLSRVPHPRLTQRGRISPEDVVPREAPIESFRLEFKNAAEYVRRPVTDVAAEIMTIVAVKPEGLTPRYDMIKDLPEWVLFEDYIAGVWEGMGRVSHEGFLRSIDEIRARIQADLQEIEGAVKGLREGLVSDVLGRVVFVSVQ